MGELIEGVWRDQAPASSGDGRFHRAETRFRNWITADGSPGPTGQGGFKAEPGRYHLYVSLACPWAHRTLIMRRLKRLEDAIGVSVVHWHMDRNGWEFREGPGATGDRLHGLDYLHQVYTRARPDYTGRASVPVLWDKESGDDRQQRVGRDHPHAESAFDRVGADGPDFYPQALRPAIDAINDRVYETVNNGVYKAGFARSQEAYEEAAKALFATLDDLEDAARRAALSRRRPDHRGGLAPVHDAGPLRSGLCGPLQVQPSPPGRLPATSGPMRASCTRCRASPGPWISTTSSSTTTAATDR